MAEKFCRHALAGNRKEANTEGEKSCFTFPSNYNVEAGSGKKGEKIPSAM